MGMKKMAALLLALCLSLSLCLPAAAAGAVLKLEAPESLPAVGGTFTVDVTLTGNPGISAAQFTLQYDKKAVRCTAAEAGEALGGMSAAVNPDADSGAILAAAGSSVAAEDGVLGSFTFQVLEQRDPKLGLTGVVLAGPDGQQEISYTVEGSAEVAPRPEQPDPKPDPKPVQPDPKPVQPDPKPEEKPDPTPVEPEQPLFTDVPLTYWAAPYISRAVEQKLVTGYADGTFHPAQPVTRAQFVTMLWRMAGSPAAEQPASFADVPQDAWCAPQVAWASGRGIVNGVTAERFQPNGVITREQAMAILFRYSGGVSGTEMMLHGVYDGQFADSASIGAWAKDAVYWAIYNGIVTGVTETTVVPKGTATRAQISVIFLRYMDRIG